MLDERIRDEWPQPGRISRNPSNCADQQARIRLANHSSGVESVVRARHQHPGLFFKGAGQVAERLLGQAPARIAVPALVLFELETGIARSAAPVRRQAQLSELADVVTVLDFDTRCARQAAAIHASLEAAGLPIGPVDTLTAGTALAPAHA